MKLIIASNNAHKIREIKEILASRFEEIVSMREAGLDMEIEENGTTFRENALIKARAVAETTGCAALADDSGLAIDALGGAPGVYSARYSGVHGDDEANNDKVLREMESVPDGQRGAAYHCAIALILPNGRELVGEGRCCGEILRTRQGKGGFGYDPLFFMPELGRTMAQLTAEEKNAISHRFRALEALAALLEAEE